MDKDIEIPIGVDSFDSLQGAEWKSELEKIKKSAKDNIMSVRSIV